MSRCAAILVLLPVCLFAQMVPDAPILDFRLPRFGEDGYKSWELRGISATSQNEELILVEGLDLLTFTGGADLKIDTRIRSPRATIDLKKNMASGDSSLFVSGPEFSIEGRNWSWEQTDSRIVVRESVRVRIDDQIDILR